jgi:hypothetical protein
MAANYTSADTPPITQILPILSRLWSFLASTSTALTSTTLSLIKYPLVHLSPTPLLLYLLSPLLVLADAS